MNDDNVLEYLYLGHPYRSNAVVDERVEDLKMWKFDQVWLGGDVCSETTQNQITLNYQDALFDLGNPGNFWSLGNHDIRNGNTQWIFEKTKRGSFYTSYLNGLTVSVINTNWNIGGANCDSISEQFEMLNNVCDTIEHSSHFVLLAHQVIWGEIDSLVEVKSYANADGSSQVFSCNPNEKFAKSFYPRLIELENQGIDVVIIAGDMGQTDFSYHTTTAEGVDFVASGFCSDTQWNSQFPTHGLKDQVAVFYHDTVMQTFTWEFKFLDDMLLDHLQQSMLRL